MSQFNTNTKAMCVKEKGAKFELLEFQRKPVGDNDVAFDVQYCGICHSDIHFADNDLQNTMYPCVPGHELAGTVREVGSKVTKFQVGDKVGVGCFIDSCLECQNCKKGDEQYCAKGMTATYNSVPQFGRAGDIGFNYTLGGYSTKYVVDENFLVKVPTGYALEKAGPILCAGITLYDPLKHWGALKGGLKVGIAGLGGLGLMGAKLAKAMGNEVTVISTSPSKEQAAYSIGADYFVNINDEQSVKTQTGKLDLILNTISAVHQVNKYLPLLSTNGTIVQFGLFSEPHVIHQFPLLMGRLTIAGSCIGGIRNTQECMDFCFKHNIYCETKLVSVSQIDDVYATLKSKNDQVIRYVIDTATFDPNYKIEVPQKPQNLEFSSEAKALAVKQAKANFEVLDFKRKQMGDHDVAFSVDYCGVCHSDVHTADNDWLFTAYPCCPGHELSGTVQAVGAKVTNFQVGDKVGVGCFIDACLNCDNCRKGDENYCRNMCTFTYNGQPIHGRAGSFEDFTHTYGGYSNKHVVHEKFVIRIPNEYPAEKAGPVFCAGITLYDPLKHWGALNGGLKIAIAGFGGLGLMGVKLAVAMGNEVTVLSTTASKEQAAKDMGAKFVLMSNEQQKLSHKGYFDLILNTISVGHDIHQYIDLLSSSGTLVELGGVMEPHNLNQLPLIFGRVAVAGSCIGGIKNTQECIDFCNKHGIYPEIKIVPGTPEGVDQVFNILRGKNDQAIRYVLDLKNHLH